MAGSDDFFGQTETVPAADMGLVRHELLRQHLKTLGATEHLQQRYDEVLFEIESYAKERHVKHWDRRLLSEWLDSKSAQHPDYRETYAAVLDIIAESMSL